MPCVDVPDIVRHESRSTAARYLLPTWIALEVVCAYGLARLHDRSPRLRSAGALAFAGLLGLGALSGAVGGRYETWWADGSATAIGPIARIVRAASQPVAVIFSGDHPGWDFAPMELANEVPPTIRLQLVRADAVVADPHAAETFVLDPSPHFIAATEARRWHWREVYRYTAGDATVRALRREADRSRRGTTFANAAPSLWRAVPPSGEARVNGFAGATRRPALAGLNR